MKQNTVKREETYFEKLRRLRNRKQVIKYTFKKGVYFEYAGLDRVLESAKQPDVVVRLINEGSMDDGTQFVTITIEGYTLPKTEQP